MTCRTVTGEKVTVEKEGGTRGQEMIEVDVIGGKMKGRKEVRVDVTKRKSIIIIKLYFDTIKSETYVPFTGVYIHVNR